MTLILGLETSCDETAASVVLDGRHILSNVVASQIELHREYGGVFPELASRQHVLDIVPTIEQALLQAAIDWTGLSAVAVTSGPGLVGSLLVGANVAKSIAWAKSLPLIGVNHLEAHLYANWLHGAAQDPRPRQEPPPAPRFPLLCLIVSGGHSDLVLMSGHGQYQVLGRTLDDAAGEAFDKVARLLGLGYPGGPAIQAAAQGGNPHRFNLPRALLKDGPRCCGTEYQYDFSFSGLKTAVLRIVQSYGGQGARTAQAQTQRPGSSTTATLRTLPLADLAASFQAAVVDVLVEKTRRAAEELQVEQVLLAGGVASNVLLRQQMRAKLDLPVQYPPPALCTDNAAMVASAGYFKYMTGERSGWELDVRPGMGIPQHS